VQYKEQPKSRWGHVTRMMDTMDPGQRQVFEFGSMVNALLCSDVISKLSRYEVTLQREFSQTLTELRQQMANRPEPTPLEPPEVILASLMGLLRRHPFTGLSSAQPRKPAWTRRSSGICPATLCGLVRRKT
jgi:hypothetical protein